MADAWGIDEAFKDALGVVRPTRAATRKAILAAMGADAGAPLATEPSVRVIRADEGATVTRPAEILLEDGGIVRVDRTFPPDLPLGYHQLRALDGDRTLRLIVSPGRCHLPDELRTWGWAAQLYATRSSRSWGIGDLADLERLARWSASVHGAGMLLINPLHAATPVAPQESSPYCPTSRRYRNVLYLSVEDVPGAAELGGELEPIATAGRALNRDRRIDRDAVLRLKMGALERLWQRFGGDAELERYAREQGDPLQQFATFCALAEVYGRRWRDWPGEYRRPESPAVARFAETRGDRIRFHAWLQWLLDRQLARAGRAIALTQDLPIGVDPSGADAWAWQDVLAVNASVGAPPDRYNKNGQDWGLPPFVPHRLTESGFEPFIQTIRATLRHAGGLRIDHVMGLFRLFWIPKGLGPADGAYVRYPADDLLAIVALESHRARAFVVGEDLGTVEEGVRERLAEHRILSYRVVWFETDVPAKYPPLALAAVTTHDLPTIRGLWSGTDVQAQHAIGLQPNEAGFREIRERLRAMTGAGEDAPAERVIERAYELLAGAPSVIVTATLDDALGLDERPNMPGTVAEWPNWSIALPVPLEQIERLPLPNAIAAALARRADPPRSIPE